MVLSRSHELDRGDRPTGKTDAYRGFHACHCSDRIEPHRSDPHRPSSGTTVRRAQATGRAHRRSASAAASPTALPRIDHDSDLAASGACQEIMIKEGRVRRQQIPSVSGEKLTASLFHVAVPQPPTIKTGQASSLSLVSRSWWRVPPPHLHRDLLRLFSRGPVSFQFLGHSGRPRDNGVYAGICPRMRPLNGLITTYPNRCFAASPAPK